MPPLLGQLQTINMPDSHNHTITNTTHPPPHKPPSVSSDRGPCTAGATGQSPGVRGPTLGLCLRRIRAPSWTPARFARVPPAAAVLPAALRSVPSLSSRSFPSTPVLLSAAFHSPHITTSDRPSLRIPKDDVDLDSSPSSSTGRDNHAVDVAPVRILKVSFFFFPSLS